MTLTDVLQLAGNFGPMGLMVAYLIWKDLRTDKATERADALAKERIEADIEMARSFTLLNATIEGIARHVR